MTTRSFSILACRIEGLNYVAERFRANHNTTLEDTPEALAEKASKIIKRAGEAFTLTVNRWATLGTKRHAQLDMTFADGKVYRINIMSN